MTPRPFYRSRLFWLGLPGLLFLLWGWWMSTGHWSRAWLGAWGIGQMGGEVFAIWESNEGPDWGIFGVRHDEITGEEAREHKDGWAMRSESDPSFRYVLIPYYWPVLAYAATWLLTLAWWQRRRTRMMKLHAAP